MERIVPVLHGVFSVQKVVEVARITYGLGFKNFVVSKAASSAAQTGVPEANKLALKLGRNFVVLSDIGDVLELLKPVHAYGFVPRGYGGALFDPMEVLEASERGTVVLVFGGGEPGLSKRELEYLTPVTLGLGNIGVVGEAAIALYLVYKASSSAAPGSSTEV